MGLHTQVIKYIVDHCPEAKCNAEKVKGLIQDQPTLATIDVLINMMRLCRSFDPSDVYRMIKKIVQATFALGGTEVIVIIDNAKHVPKCKNSFAPRGASLEKKGIKPYPLDAIIQPDGVFTEGFLQSIDPERFKLSRHLREPLLNFILAQVDYEWIPLGCRLGFQTHAEGEITYYTHNSRIVEDLKVKHGEADLSQWLHRRRLPKHHAIFVSADSDVVALALTNLKDSTTAYTFWQRSEDVFYDLRIVIKTLTAQTGLNKRLLMCWFILCGTDYFDITGHYTPLPDDYQPELKPDGTKKRRKRKHSELVSAGIHYMIGIEPVMDAIRERQGPMMIAATDVDEPDIALQGLEAVIIELYRHLIVRIDKEVINIPADITIHKLRSLFQNHTKYFFPSPDDISTALQQFQFCYDYWQCDYITDYLATH